MDILIRDIDPDAEYHCHNLDVKLNRLSAAVETAIINSSHGEDPGNLLRQYNNIFLQTHRSIRLLAKTTFDYDGRAGDAISLAREQIEKIFSIALLVEDYQKWSKVFLVDGWTKAYQQFLRDKAEYEHLERLKEHFSSVAPARLEQFRLFTGASLELKLYLESKFLNPKAKLPDSIKDEIFRFPTPKTAIKQIQDPQRKSALERWYSEYETYCSFTHILLQKTMVSMAQSASHERLIEKRHSFLTNMIEPALGITFTATTYALTDVSTYLNYNVEAMLCAEELWKTLKESSLLGRAIWDRHANYLMIDHR